jgi:putative ABC transport system permease protein
MEMESIARTVTRDPVAGTAEEMYRRAAAGEGLIVSDNLAELHGLRLGDALEIAAPYGTLALPISGIIVDYTDQLGSILMDRSVFIRYWQDDTVNMFRVYLTPGAAAADVRRRILELYEGRRQVFVLTNEDLRRHVTDVVGQWFGLTSVQIAVAVLVAILGIVNTLTVSITDRRRELAVIQAVGGLRSQIRRAIWLEALVVGALGLILGCSFGALNLLYVLQIVHRDISGFRLDYVFPVATAIALVPTILGASFAAALWPGELAVRGSLVEGLEYE